jgi:hypothetical protein
MGSRHIPCRGQSIIPAAAAAGIGVHLNRLLEGNTQADFAVEAVIFAIGQLRGIAQIGIRQAPIADGRWDAQLFRYGHRDDQTEGRIIQPSTTQLIIPVRLIFRFICCSPVG